MEKKKKIFYQELIDKIDKTNWNAELRIDVVKEIRDGIRRELDVLADRIKGIEEEIERVKERRKGNEQDKEIKKELDELFDTKLTYDKDAEKMKEQVMGKWIEAEQSFHGGLEEEIKSIENSIKGGEEFKLRIIQKLRGNK